MKLLFLILSLIIFSACVGSYDSYYYNPEFVKIRQKSDYETLSE